MENEVKEKKNERHKLADVVPLPQPYVIFLDPCGCCNFKCSFCPVNVATENSEERHKVMSMDLFKKILEDIKGFPNAIKVVELYALGEPLMNKNVAKMVRMLKESGKVEKVRMTTNASLLTPELSRSLVDAGLDYIKISLESMHTEDYKNVCGVKLNWESFIENIRQLYNYSHNVKIGGGTEIGIKVFSNVLKDGDEEGFFETFRPITDYIWIETAHNMWAEFDEFECPNDNEVTDEFSSRFAGRDICSYPFTHMLICSNGDIGLCCLDWNHKTCYANASQTNVVDAWNSRELYEIRMKMLKKEPIPFCSSCTGRGYDDIDQDAEIIMKRITEKRLI